MYLSDWLRYNCLEVFHYVAKQLKDVPLFEGGNGNIDREYGAVYNCFDFDPASLGDDGDSEWSGVPSSSQTVWENSADVLPQEAVDYAVIEADDRDGILYDALAFDHPLHDIENPIDSDIYMSTIFRILKGEWKVIFPMISEESLEAFERRKRIDWKGIDSFYDAWLFATDQIRDCFPLRKFNKKYPNWRQYLNSIVESSSSSENENENDGEKQVSVKEEPISFQSVVDNSNMVIIISDDEEENSASGDQNKQNVSKPNEMNSDVEPVNSSLTMVTVKKENSFVPNFCNGGCEAICISSDEE